MSHKDKKPSRVTLTEVNWQNLPDKAAVITFCWQNGCKTAKVSYKDTRKKMDWKKMRCCRNISVFNAH